MIVTEREPDIASVGDMKGPDAEVKSQSPTGTSTIYTSAVG